MVNIAKIFRVETKDNHAYVYPTNEDEFTTKCPKKMYIYFIKKDASNGGGDVFNDNGNRYNDEDGEAWVYDYFDAKLLWYFSGDSKYKIKYMEREGEICYIYRCIAKEYLDDEFALKSQIPNQ